MTVTLSLDMEQEQRVRAVARIRGVDADALLDQVVQRAINDIAAPQQRTAGWVSGLHAGRGWISDDFDAPLPDSFWLGDE
jgi:hypothetical protein